jgi:phage tail tape-measure protein
MDHNSHFGQKISKVVLGLGLVTTLTAGCAGGSLTTREKGAGIGALGGAAAGGIIGSAVRHPGAGALIGGALGLGAGALIGDQLQGRDNAASDQDRQINQNQQEILRQQRELEELRRRPEY